MVDIQKIIAQAIQKGATDIHLMSESKPIYRIGDSLVKMEGSTALKIEDMNELKTTIFDKNKTANSIYECAGIDVAVNLSSSNNIPVFAMKILKKELPEYEELKLPDVLRKMTHQAQGLILIAGNKKSGKRKAYEPK